MNPIQINLYDYAKNIIKVETPMDQIAVNRTCGDLADFIYDNKYTMLLCKERADVTVFNSMHQLDSKKEIVQAVKETLENRGSLLVCDKQADGSYEIWIRDPETNDNFAYYLFDFEQGVIEI